MKGLGFRQARPGKVKVSVLCSYNMPRGRVFLCDHGADKRVRYAGSRDPKAGFGSFGGVKVCGSESGTYCYCVVVLDVEIVIIVEEESVVVAVVLVGHGRQSEVQPTLAWQFLGEALRCSVVEEGVSWMVQKCL